MNQLRNQDGKGWLQKIVKGIVVALAVLTILGRFGVVHWSFDWAALLHHYYFGGAVLACLVLLGMRQWGWVGMTAAVVAVNGWLLAPYLPMTPVAESGTGEPIRVLVYNMYYANDDLSGMVQDIEAYEADVVFIMEYSFDTQAAIETEFDSYEYRLIEPSRMTMGLALFSHLPIRNADVHRRPGTRIPIF